MSIKEHGIEKFGKSIQQNVDQANYLADLVDKNEDLELLAPIPLNIVCFRYNPRNAYSDILDEVNKEIIIQLHEKGIAIPSYTTLRGKYAIRVCITNHRSQKKDFDEFILNVLEIGKDIISNYSK